MPEYRAGQIIPLRYKSRENEALPPGVAEVGVSYA
jgi:hypothetical protein